VIDMHVIESFMRWWNSLAQRNGKLKFKNQREAAEFVRRVLNEHGGPNAKILEMRKRYEDVNRARATECSTPRPEQGQHKTVHG
jgi:hypothetical protein